MIMRNFYDLRHNGVLILRSDKLSYLLVKLCEEVCPSTMRPINPAMLMKAYEALMNGWSVTNTVSGHTLDLTPGQTT
jgi:hypothetical protein